MSNQTTPNKVLVMMNLPDKAAVEKFCRGAIVSEQELEQVSVAGWAPRRYF